MAGAMTSISSGQPRRRSPRRDDQVRSAPPPPPPYSSGRCMPRKPAAPSSSHSSVGSSARLGAIEEVGEPVLVDDLTHRLAQRVQLGGGRQQITHQQTSQVDVPGMRASPRRRRARNQGWPCRSVRRPARRTSGGRGEAVRGAWRWTGAIRRRSVRRSRRPARPPLGRHDLGDHPEFQRLGGGEYAVEVAHLRRDPTADEAGEEPGVAAVGPERQGTGPHRELRAVTGDDEVRDVQQTERAATGGAVHCRHDRHGQVGENA